MNPLDLLVKYVNFESNGRTRAFLKNFYEFFYLVSLVLALPIVWRIAQHHHDRTLRLDAVGFRLF